MSSKQISKIKPGDPSASLEVRVIKKWITRSTKPEMCYLLVDIYVDAIEAVADVNEEEYFDTIISVQSCYSFTKYVSIPSRNYKIVVPHIASLKIGQMASFEPILHTIPNYYYEFASYDALEYRIKSHKLLTDYIGRIEKVTPIKVKTGQELLKILLQDEGEHLIKITLWDTNLFQLETQGIIGEILAITSTMVTEWKGNLQLESTPATRISINPPIPDLKIYISKKNLLIMLFNT